MITAKAYRIAGFVLAGALFALGVAIIVATSGMRVSPVYATAGPQLFPYLVGGLTILISLYAFVEAFRGRLAPEGELAMDVLPPVIMAAGLVVNILTMRSLGWIISATLLFVIGTLAFTRRRILLSAVVGLIFAAGSYFMFDRWLGLRLPAGILSFG